MSTWVMPHDTTKNGIYLGDYDKYEIFYTVEHKWSFKVKSIATLSVALVYTLVTHNSRRFQVTIVDTLSF